MQKRPTYVLELRPPPGDDKPHLRLKKALKCLLRSFGLRCLSVAEKSPETAESHAVDLGVAEATEAAS